MSGEVGDTLAADLLHHLKELPGEDLRGVIPAAIAEGRRRVHERPAKKRELRPAGEGPGDRNPLAFTAGE